MTSDETIRKVVDVIGDLPGYTDGQLRKIALDLHSAGLLAPAPLREEWGSEMRDARPEGGSLVLRARDPDNARWQIEHNPERATGRLVRRYVTDWEEA